MKLDLNFFITFRKLGTLSRRTTSKNDLEGESQNLQLINHHFTTVSSHFFAISIKIFHETEILTVILRCCMDLYLNWFSSYGPKRENFRFRFLLIL